MSVKPLDRNYLSSVSKLHADLLPESIFAIFGEEFLSRYFYQEALRQKNMFCDIYEVSGKTVGFVTYTNDAPRIFLKQIKKRPFLLSIILLKALFRDIRRFKFILFSAHFIFKKRKYILPDVPSEILSFAVLPEYRVHTMDRSTGIIHETEFYKENNIKVANELFNSMTLKLKQLNCEELKIMTPTAHVYSNRFYQKMGCTLIPKRCELFSVDVNVYLKKL